MAHLKLFMSEASRQAVMPMGSILQLGMIGGMPSHQHISEVFNDD
jgi:hypothetical protein